MEWLKEWIRNVAFYYLFVTVIANVLPDGKEKKTVQFFLGLLITLFFLRPILHLGELEINLEQNVMGNVIEEHFSQMQREMDGMDLMGTEYLLSAYEVEMEEQISQWVTTYGYEMISCDIDLIMEDEMELRDIQLEVLTIDAGIVEDLDEKKQEEFLKKEFMEVYNIPEGNINISIQG